MDSGRILKIEHREDRIYWICERGTFWTDGTQWFREIATPSELPVTPILGCAPRPAGSSTRFRCVGAGVKG